MIDFSNIHTIYVIIEPESSKKERNIITNILRLLGCRKEAEVFWSDLWYNKANREYFFRKMLEDVISGSGGDSYDLIINALPEFSNGQSLENLVYGVAKGLGNSKLVTRKQLRYLAIAKIIDLEGEDYEQ